MTLGLLDHFLSYLYEPFLGEAGAAAEVYFFLEGGKEMRDE